MVDFRESGRHMSSRRFLEQVSGTLNPGIAEGILSEAVTLFWRETVEDDGKRRKLFPDEVAKKVLDKYSLKPGELLDEMAEVFEVSPCEVGTMVHHPFHGKSLRDGLGVVAVHVLQTQMRRFPDIRDAARKRLERY